MIKKYIIRVFLCAEIVIFAWIYFFGARGLHVAWHLHKQHAYLYKKYQIHQERVQALQHRYYQWQEDPAFYQEKIARERLYLARETDHLFFIKKG